MSVACISTNSTLYADSHDDALPAQRSQSSKSKVDIVDVPLPSIEQNDESDATQHSANNESDKNIESDLRNLRLSSAPPQVAPFTGSIAKLNRESSTGSPAPSLRITPSASCGNGRQSTRADSLAKGFESLALESHTQPRPAHGRLSPSPGRRRRSSSHTTRIIYSIEDEEPSSPFHGRAIQEALAKAKGLSQHMVQVLGASTLHREPSSTVGQLYEEAQRLSKFQLPETRIVGLVGDSGVGKSSLINSLLDKRGLARASSSGAACTCVVTEYHFHDDDDFVIEINLFSREELRQQFEQLLHAYQRWESKRTEKETTESGEGERKEKAELRKRAELARSTFQTCFRTHLDREDRMVLFGKPIEEALDLVMSWTDELLLPLQRGNIQDCNIQERRDSIEACSSRLKALTSEMETPDRGCPWPFISKIKVSLRAIILSKGLIIADLPGLRDLNPARQLVTERYIRDCHQIFAVTRIGRAKTDVGVKEIFELARKASLVNLDVICTQSDDIRVDEARDDYPAQGRAISALEEDMRSIETRIASLEAELDDLDTNSDNLDFADGHERIAIERRLREAKKQRRSSEFQLRNHIVTIRNRQVSAEMGKLYGTSSQPRPARVFCVSNTYYRDWREETVQAALPYINLSGIPDLRRYCIGIVADSHLHATKDYIEHRIPALLGSIDLWIQVGSGNASAERKQATMEFIAKIEKELDAFTHSCAVDDISTALNKQFRLCIAQRMRRQAPIWSAGAVNASLEWQPLHSSTYSAFCRNYGRHYTKAAGSRWWNEEALEVMHADMQGHWQRLNQTIDRQCIEYEEEMESALENMMVKLRREVRSNVEVRKSVDTFLRTLRHRMDLLRGGCEATTNKFQGNIRALQADALSPLRTSIFGVLMEPSYRRANAEHGSGSDQRRKATIEGGFASPKLFPLHYQRVRLGYDAAKQKFDQTLSEVLNEQTNYVFADLATLKNANAIKESEKSPEFRVSVEKMAEMVRDGLNEIGGTVGHQSRG